MPRIKSERAHGGTAVFERALIFIGTDAPSPAVLSALERLIPGTAVIFELRTIPASGRGRDPGPFRSGVPDFTPRALGSSRRILRRTADPALTVFQIVEELGIDVVALTAGSDGRRRSRLSATAERVIDSGRVPVLLVGGRYVPPAPNLRRMLLPFDPFVAPQILLDLTVQVSRRTQAEVDLLGFIPISSVPEHPGVVFEDGPIRRASPEERISAFARDLAARGCRVRSLHSYEDPTEAIPRYARSLDADMVLLSRLGTQQAGFRITDALSRPLASTLDCPVLFVGDGGRPGGRRSFQAG